MKVKTSISISERLDKLIENTAKAFGWTKSRVVSKSFKYLDFLYNFMNKYMEPNDQNPSDDDIKKIEKIGEMLNWI